MEAVIKPVLAISTTLSVLCLLCITSSVGEEAIGGTPESHMINTTWHPQEKCLLCGEGALEVVYDYWGPDIDQKKNANVARSSLWGTQPSDMVRAGHFSNQSSAQGRAFPKDVPEAGYPDRPLGYVSMPHSSDEFWLDDLKGLIADDIPVILLMAIAPGDDGGHYRVAVGYDDFNETLYFNDPWGRDLEHKTNWTGIYAWRYDDLQSCWNYTAEGEAGPYFALVMMPWDVNVSISSPSSPDSIMTVTADITYLCPDPIDRSLFPAKNATAVITLPEGMRLASGSRTVSLGDLPAGWTARARWKVLVDGPAPGRGINVTACGTVSGEVPETRWTGQKKYPPCNYTDIIGGEGTLTL